MEEGPSSPVDALELQPGATLAGRYRLEDLVSEDAGSRSWRALDVILNRSVGVQALPSDDPRAPRFLAAARRSTAVPDPRFLRVLDAVADEGGHTYVVREWTRAVSLATLLGEGPLGNRRAAVLVAEVADAVAHAHDAGVQHRRLDPASVLVRENDAVRISGLGTEDALHDTGAEYDDEHRGAPTTASALAAEAADVTALGELLYACLVARWPGGRAFGLPPAPTDHGRLLRPRQVRAGVARDVDSICDRILGQPPRHHATPLSSARDVATALQLAGEDESSLVDPAPSLVGPETEPVPLVRDTSSSASPRPVAPSPAGASARTTVQSSPQARRPATPARLLVAVGVALLVVMAAGLAYFAGRNSASQPGEQAASFPNTPSPAAAHVLRPQGVTDFDPLGGDGSENPEAAAYAIDGDPKTAWTTSQYSADPHLGNLKPGVGLLVDLGSAKSIADLTVTFGATPTNYEVWAAAPGQADPPTKLSQLEQVASRRAAPARSRTSFDPGVTTQYLLVWLTKLPSESYGLYQGVVDEIAIEGAG